MLSEDKSTEAVKEKFIKDDPLLRKVVAIVTLVAILLIPTYLKTQNLNHYGGTTETVYMWPWMVLIHIVPQEEFASDQYVINGFPWSLVFFIPFYYAMKHALQLYFSSDDRVKKAGFIAIAGLVQLIVIFLYSNSNPSYTLYGEPTEDRTVYYIPEIILILLGGAFAAKWYSEEVSASLTVSKLKKQKEEILEKEIQE